MSGYEELTNVFQTQTNDKSNEFSKYASLMKKFVIDSNAAAQEKGMWIKDESEKDIIRCISR